MEPAASIVSAPYCWFCWVVLGAIAYFSGSVPFAFILAKSRGVDLFKVGSGNIGATNLGRALGKPWGFLCFFLDAAKGALPVLLAGWWMGILGKTAIEIEASTAWSWLGVAIFAILGHTLSPWIGFKGGKGVATGFGALVALWPAVTIPALAALTLWILILLLFRFISLASIVAALSIPCCIGVAALLAPGEMSMGDRAQRAFPFLAVSGLIALFVVWKHRANIARLKDGTEPKVFGKPSPTPSTESSPSSPPSTP